MMPMSARKTRRLAPNVPESRRTYPVFKIANSPQLKESRLTQKTTAETGVQPISVSSLLGKGLRDWAAPMSSQNHPARTPWRTELHTEEKWLGGRQGLNRTWSKDKGKKSCRAKWWHIPKQTALFFNISQNQQRESYEELTFLTGMPL